MIPTTSPHLGLRMENRGAVAPPSDFSEGCDHIDRIQAMNALSGSVYSCSDYIRRRAKKETFSCHDQLSITEYPVDHDKVDTVCREKMCEWSYRVCDHFKMNREIVAVSFSYLDRFMEKHNCDRTTFKLAAMTTLYMANKIYGGNPIFTIGHLAELSRREFEMSHISEMELMILQALAWRLHPPTIQCFIDSFYHYISMPCNEFLSNALYRRARFFAELAIYDFKFVSKDRSLLAIASLMNAMEGMEDITIEQQRNFLEAIVQTFDLKHTTNDVERVRDRLWYIYSMSAQYKVDVIAGAPSSSDIPKEQTTKAVYHMESPSSGRSVSPVSVATRSGPYHRL